MPIFLIEAVASTVCGILDALGGFHWLFARRFILPFLFGAVASVVACVSEASLHSWWIGFMVLPAIGTFSLGYPKDGNAGRGLWLFINAVTLTVGLTATTHLGVPFLPAIGWLSWVIFSVYVIGAGVLGGTYKDLNQVVGDFITGTYLGSILLFVK